jgi:hypothetical protein
MHLKVQIYEKGKQAYYYFLVTEELNKIIYINDKDKAIVAYENIKIKKK